MEKYTKNMKLGEYLLKSRKGENKLITAVQVYRIISEAAKRIGLEEIGTHTMRKTFGYFHCLFGSGKKQEKNLFDIAKQIFNGETLDFVTT